jgi:hypothetical protein
LKKSLSEKTEKRKKQEWMGSFSSYGSTDWLSKQHLGSLSIKNAATRKMTKEGIPDAIRGTELLLLLLIC